MFSDQRAGAHGFVPVELGTTQPLEMRLLDVAGALLLLILVAPLMLIIAALVFAFDPGPILFAHVRIGLGGQSFRCFKFRTMAVDAEARLAAMIETDAQARHEWQCTRKLRRDPRITGIGGILRKLSLDELPQLFNVLSGEMSLVGPRPIVAGEIHNYGRYFQDYCSVKPGITGMWQVNGRNNVSYRRRVACDVLYVRTQSLITNLAILTMTVPSVVFARGSY